MTASIKDVEVARWAQAKGWGYMVNQLMVLICGGCQIASLL